MPELQGSARLQCASEYIPAQLRALYQRMHSLIQGLCVWKSDNVDSLEPLPQVAPPSTVPATKRPRTQEVEKDELVGTTYLGKYELVSVLGAGGMGVIYKAHQVFWSVTMPSRCSKINLLRIRPN